MSREELFEVLNEEGLDPNSDIAVLRDVVRCVALRKNFDTKTMKKFGELTSNAHHHRRLKPSATVIGFEFVGLSPSARKISELALLVEDLLVTTDLERIHECAGEECDLLFFDESKNKSKKWCDMGHCGMLRKSKVYYDKHRRVKPLISQKTKNGAQLP